MTFLSHLPFNGSVLPKETTENTSQKDMRLKGLQTLKYGGLVSIRNKAQLNSEQLDFIIIIKTFLAILVAFIRRGSICMIKYARRATSG